MTKSNYVMELSFDANQKTKSLQYQFYDSKGERCKEVSHGKTAGTFNFVEGDQIQIKVLATIESDHSSQNEPELSVDIRNCTLVSIKGVGMSDLSLFNPDNACLSVDSWSKPEENYNRKTGVKTISISSTPTIPVATKNGQWQLSGYLSVTLTTGSNPFNELYYFDPEMTTGSGGDFGP